MGSNKLAEEFSKLILEDSAANQGVVNPSLDFSQAKEPSLKQSIAKQYGFSQEQLNRQ